MRRGEVWTISGGPGYAGKPRPALVIQGDLYPFDHSVTICGFTTDPSDSPFTRPVIEPAPGNGLLWASRLMIDKIMTVPRSRLGSRLGTLTDEEIGRVDRALIVFFGLAG